MEKVERFQSEFSGLRAPGNPAVSLSTLPVPHSADSADLLTKLTLNLCNVAQLASTLESQNAELGAEMGRLVERVRQLELEKLVLSDHLAAFQIHPSKTGAGAPSPAVPPFHQRADGYAVTGAGTGSARAKLQRRIGGSMRVRRSDHSPYNSYSGARQRLDSGGTSDRFGQLAADVRKSAQHVSQLEAPSDSAIKRSSSGDIHVKGSAHSIPECLFASENVSISETDTPQVPKRYPEHTGTSKPTSSRTSTQEATGSVRSSIQFENRVSHRVSVTNSPRISAVPTTSAQTAGVQFAGAAVAVESSARANASSTCTPTRKSLQTHSDSRFSAKSDPSAAAAASDVIADSSPLLLPTGAAQLPVSASASHSPPSNAQPPQPQSPPARKKSAATSAVTVAVTKGSKWKGKRPFRLVRQLFRHSTTQHAKVHLVRDAAGATHKCDAEGRHSPPEVAGAAAASAKKERHSFPGSLLHSLMKLSRSRTLPAPHSSGGNGGSGCCGCGSGSGSGSHSHSEREERTGGKGAGVGGQHRPLSDQSAPGGQSGPTLKTIPTITLLASDGGEKKLKQSSRAFKFVQAAEVAVRTLAEYEPLRLGHSSHSPVGSASRLRKLSVGLLEGRPVFSAGGGPENDLLGVAGGADDAANGALIVRSSSMSTSNSPRPSIDLGTRGTGTGLTGGLPAIPPTTASACRPKPHGGFTSVSSGVSKWTTSSGRRKYVACSAITRKVSELNNELVEHCVTTVVDGEEDNDRGLLSVIVQKPLVLNCAHVQRPYWRSDELTALGAGGGGGGRSRDRERRGRSPLTKQSRSVDLLMVPGQAQAEMPVALSLAPSVQTFLARPHGAAQSPPIGSTATLVSTGSLPSTTTSGTPAAPSAASSSDEWRLRTRRLISDLIAKIARAVELAFRDEAQCLEKQPVSTASSESLPKVLMDTSIDLRHLLQASLTQQLCLLALAADSNGYISSRSLRRPLGRAASSPSLSPSFLQRANGSLPISNYKMNPEIEKALRKLIDPADHFRVLHRLRQCLQSLEGAAHERSASVAATTPVASCYTPSRKSSSTNRFFPGVHPTSPTSPLATSTSTLTSTSASSGAPPAAAASGAAPISPTAPIARPAGLTVANAGDTRVPDAQHTDPMCKSYADGDVERVVLAKAGVKLPACTLTQSLPQTPTITTAELLGEQSIGAVAAAARVEMSLGAGQKTLEPEGQKESWNETHYVKSKAELRRQESRRLGQQLLNSTIGKAGGGDDGESPSTRRYSEGDLHAILRCEAPLCRPEEESDSLMNESHEGPEAGLKPQLDAAGGGTGALATSDSLEDPFVVQMRETALGGARAAGLTASSLIGGSDRYVGASGSEQSRSHRALERYRRLRRTLLKNMPAIFGGARRPASQPVSSASPAGATHGGNSKQRGGAIARLCSAAFAVEVAPVNKDAATLVSSNKSS